MKTYIYKPFRFYITVFALTWLFWIVAAIYGTKVANNGLTTVLMLLGLITPAATAIITVFTSKSPELKKDFKEKMLGAFRVRPIIVLLSILIFGTVIASSILLSALFGQPLSQFSFVGEFSFSIGGIPTLLTLIVTALLEELGWRGYAEDAIGSYCNWWNESLISGSLWALWHLPLFFIPGSYQWGLLQQNPWYVVNFFVGILPLDILFAWVYIKNKRSIFACMFFHFSVNFLQEQIAMTQVTKCLETGVLYIAAAIIVLANKDLFFEKRHIGNLLGEVQAVPIENKLKQRKTL